MKYKAYLGKAKVLLREADEDSGYRCYNRMVSASWLVIEVLLGAIVLKLGEPFLGRSNKLLSIMHMIYGQYFDLGEINTHDE